MDLRNRVGKHDRNDVEGTVRQPRSMTHPTPPSELEHSFPATAWNVSSQQFSSGSLSGDCPWPKIAALPKVTYLSEGQPISNVWLMVGDIKAGSFFPARVDSEEPARPQSSLTGSARLCCSCISSRLLPLPSITSSSPSQLWIPRVLLNEVPAGDLHLSWLPGEPTCTK